VNCDNCPAPCCGEGYLSLLDHKARIGGQYEIMPVRPEFGLYALKQIDGKCVYYNEGCTIYEERPRHCREYDCRLDTRKPTTSKYWPFDDNV